VAPTPAKPTTAFRTTVGLGALEELRDVASDLRVLDADVRGEPSSGCEPDGERQTARSGFAATTSSAWRPIEPVAPSRAIRLVDTVEG
jgi:hypothetical protein